MTTGANIAEIASLVGDPGRANILASLLDGRALTAGELAEIAGVTAPTASGHLAKLVEGGLLVGLSQGRHRYFRLASSDVAQMLERMLIVAAETNPKPRATPRVAAELREARTCYDHLAGRLGVGLADALVASGAVVLTKEAGEVTAFGQALLREFGAPLDERHPRRMFCRPCLDWSERRPHFAGALGAALLTRSLGLGWIRRAKQGRAVIITPVGRRGFREVFGVDCV